MKSQKIVKFNMYTSCILLVVLVLMFIGTTIAYFTDYKQMTATLTAGNVKITLSEAAVKRDDIGNVVEDPDQDRIYGNADGDVIHEYGKIYPGMTIWKDPTITNIGDEAEWIAAKVTLTDGTGDLHHLIGYTGYQEVDIEQLLTGGLLDEHVEVDTWNGIEDVCFNDRYAMIQVADANNGIYEFYFLMLQPVEAGDSVVIFDQVVLNAMWNNEHMEELADLKIHVQAYGVQTFQMESCLQAMTTAFPDHFNFN